MAVQISENHKLLSLVSILVGFIDFVFRFGEIDLIARHFRDGRDVGPRFHGFFGEPRDAAVVIGFLIVVDMVLYSFGSISSSGIKKRLLILGLATVLTQSFSAIVGLFIFFGFLFCCFFSIRVLLTSTILGLFVVIFPYFGFFESRRLIFYFSGLKDVIFSILTSNYSSIPDVWRGQLPNLVPFSTFFERILSNDFHLSLFGSGIGSVYMSNLASGVLPEDGALPPSNLSKLLVEQGLLGLVFYSLAHLICFRSVSNLDKGRYLFVAFLYCFAMSLAHRSPVNYMCIGIAIVVGSVVAKNHGKLSTKKS